MTTQLIETLLIIVAIVLVAFAAGAIFIVVSIIRSILKGSN